MKLIAHRGNYDGKKPQKENTIEYIQDCLSLGLDAEIDIRLDDKKLFFGHDYAQENFIADQWEKYKNKLWVHCKDIETALIFKKFSGWNYFMHDNDDAAITSKNILWCHPRVGPIKGTVLVDIERKFELEGLYGVCSDNLLDLVK